MVHSVSETETLVSTSEPHAEVVINCKYIYRKKFVLPVLGGPNKH